MQGGTDRGPTLPSMARAIHHLTSVGAGLVGGAVFLVFELVFLPVAKHLPADWILRLMAALVAGPVALTHSLRPAGDFGGLLVDALLVHAALSTAYALVLCRIEDDLSVAASLAASAAIGLAIYLVNFYLLTPAFPWFATARGGVTIAAHLLFGVTTALTHKGLRRVTARPRPSPLLPPEASTSSARPTPAPAQPARSSARS
jgi:hypothetical protein